MAPLMFLSLLPLLVLVLSLLPLLRLSCRPSIHGGRLPPSPPKLPVIGHLHLVGLLPHINLRGLAKKYGSDYMLVYLGRVPTLVVSSASAAKAVLRTNDGVFASRPTSPAANALFSGSIDIAFAVYGEQWRMARKVLTTNLLTMHKVHSLRPGREEEMRLTISKIAEAAAGHQPLNLTELIHTFTTNIVCRAVSSRFFQVDGRTKIVRELIDSSVDLIGGFNIENFYPVLLQVGFIKNFVRHRAERLKCRWDNLLDKLIDDHKCNSMLQQGEQDFLDNLLAHQQEYGITADHIKATIIDILFGATDSTSTAIQFVLAELIQNPRAMYKVQDELRSNLPEGQKFVSQDDMLSMTYLKAVIKETFRLHPPAPLLGPHLSMDKVNIGEFDIPGQIPVLVNAWAIGRDASIWENAEEFVPERFLGSEIDYKGTSFDLLPFGSGRRMCPAINFSMAIYELILSNLLYSFDWEKVHPDISLDMTEDFRLTVHLKEQLILIPRTHI